MDFKTAQLLQREWASKVIVEDQLPETIRYIAGTDVAFPEQGEVARAVMVVLSYPQLDIVDQAVHEQPTEFPYMPGFLSFREVPALLGAYAKLQYKPDVVLCDGQGIAHPRRFGLACHFGLETGLPTIGVAKSRLIGDYQEPLFKRGSYAVLSYQNEQVGYVLRTRNNVKPLFISPGHRLSQKSTMDLVLACGRGYRLPEPTRLADKLAGDYKVKKLI